MSSGLPTAASKEMQEQLFLKDHKSSQSELTAMVPEGSFISSMLPDYSLARTGYICSFAVF